MAIQILAQMAVPVLLEGLKTALARIDHPAAKGAGAALDDLQRAVKNGAVTPEQLSAAQSHLEKMAAIEGESRAKTITQVNESLRAEVASNDAYVRRMRPTFGYMMAATWGAQMMAIAYVIVRDPARAGLVLNAMESLGTIWAVALSVMGIYVYQRSAEKKSAYDWATAQESRAQALEPSENTAPVSGDAPSRSTTPSANKTPAPSYND